MGCTKTHLHRRFPKKSSIWAAVLVPHLPPFSPTTLPPFVLNSCTHTYPYSFKPLFSINHFSLCFHHYVIIQLNSNSFRNSMERSTMPRENHLNFMATELRLGLPGSDECKNTNNKRASPETAEDSGSCGVPAAKPDDQETAPPAPKAQIVGWPPVKSYRKINAQAKKAEAESAMYVKVSMDGAPYLRKIDLKLYNGYSHLLNALETMFKLSIGEYSEREGYKGSEYAPAYEDKDGDLMLVGDVPWEMFMSSCKRLRIMRGADARGLGFGQ